MDNVAGAMSVDNREESVSSAAIRATTICDYKVLYGALEVYSTSSPASGLLLTPVWPISYRKRRNNIC